MRSSYKDISNLLRCPQCCVGSLIDHKIENELVCVMCGQIFPVSNKHPVLLRNDNLLFCVEDYITEYTPKKVNILHKLAERLVPSLSVNLARDRIMEMMRGQLIKLKKPLVLVVGGGGQKKWLNQRLKYGECEIVYTDIDIDADIDLFCDAHDLPFHDDCFDAVVTTAVMEHVMYPERVASEIARVLKIGGLLYSELPFIQQVHEGAYDFTRYTLSGHRRLFNHFDELDAGMVAGPGTSLAWSIENFVLAFFIGKKVRLLMKIFVRLSFSWFKYFDYLLIKRPQAMDGASCTYLYGRKMEGRVVDSDIIDRYNGAKHLTHTSN
jgi:SAM-dependent methyltransferase